MNEKDRSTLRKILVFASIAEGGTGLVLMADPALVVALLIGAPLLGAGVAAGRCFGIALLALGVACLPAQQRDDGNSRAVLAMFVYNALIALYLGYLGVVGHAWGILLWPAVVLHAVVAFLLAWGRRAGRVSKATG